MNDEELGLRLAKSIDRRVRAVTPRFGVEELLVGTQRGLARQRRLLAASIVVMLAVGGLAGYLLGHTPGENATSTRVAINDGAPGFASRSPAFEPSNIDATRADISRAFHSAFDGGVAASERYDAIQNGASIQDLTRESQQNAERFGYTKEQFAGTSITVLDTSFIDPTHAVVHFSLTIPGHGAILVDRVGYAILSDGRWKVALRTVCDLLSLDGLGRQCPPRSSPGSG